MFKLSDKVVDKKGHVFYIHEVVKKDFGKGLTDYFVLYPCFKEDFNNGFTSFVPASNADNLLKPIMNKQDALKLIDSLAEIEGYGDIPPKNRRNFFDQVLANSDEYKMCKIIKSLYEYRQQKALLKKTLSEYESRLLDTLSKIVMEELSISLDIELEKVPEFVENKLSFPFFYY